MKMLGLAALLFLLSIGTAVAFWTGTVQDQIISQDDNMMGWYTRMAVDGNGVIHVVWNERIVNYPTQQEVHYSSSADNGFTWSALPQDIVISFNDGVSVENGGDIACDPDNRLITVWSEKDPTIREIHYSISEDGGATWSGQVADQALSFPDGGDAYNPAMAIDSDGVVHVVWNQDYPVAGDLDEIYYARSTDGGLTWSSQTAELIVSFPDNAAASYPDIAVGLNDALYVVWREADDSVSTRSVVNLSISLDGGDTWSGTMADVSVTQSFRILSDPRIVVDSNGIIHVIWKGTQDEVSPFHYEAYYSRSTDGGTNWSGWSTEQMVSYYGAGEASVYIANLCADYQGNVIVSWDEDYSGDDDEIFVSYSTNGGISWTGETHQELISFPDGGPAYRPNIIAGLDNMLHVTWNEVTTTSYYQIHYSRGDAISGGAPQVSITLTPENPPIVIPATGGGFNYAIAVTNADPVPHLITVWCDITRPNGAIYGPVLGPVNVPIAPEFTISRDRTQNVPDWAPSGLYSFNGYVIVEGDTVVDSFPFEKLVTGAGNRVSDWNNWGEDWNAEVSANAVPGACELQVTCTPNPFNP
ncbi:MAG: sialidase family protein, partial [bacterium]